MPPTNDSRYAATAWGSSYLQDITCPSGQLCQVRRPGLEALMREGIITKIDKLTDLVDRKHVKRVRAPHQAAMEEIDVKSLASDPDQLLELVAMVDKVVEAIVVQPHVVRPIIRDEEGNPVLNAQGEEQLLLPSDRDPSTVYTDYIELEDRMFLLNYAVGGSADLEQFRKFEQESAGSLGVGEDLESPTE